MVRAVRAGLWGAALAAVVGLAGSGPEGAGTGAGVSVRNPTTVARPGESVVLPADAVRRALGVDDLRRVRVRDTAAGQDLIAQVLDDNDDGQADGLLVQVDLGAGETRALALTSGDPRVLTARDFRAYGRFVRERRDDFAWENDRVAHRMYGAALETWVREPLTSSGIDAWVKRTPRLVVNEWYMVDDYHRDTGEGADLYSVGRTRGCGGNGIWAGGRLLPSANFRDSRVLANGPLRVSFELTYAPWDANGLTVSEVKRITLDAGHQLNRIESRFTVHAAPREVQHAAGIRTNPGSSVATSAERGVLRTWEPLKDGAGSLGCAVVVDPAQVVEFTEADGNALVVGRVTGGRATYLAGSAWDRAGHIPTVEAWDRYLAEWAQRFARAVEVTLE
jgi:hypothetical protein